MADHVGFPDLGKKFVTSSIKLIMADLDAIGCVDGFDLHLAVGNPWQRPPSGTSGFSIKLAAGVLCTGTRKCISTLAAAEGGDGFTGLASMRGIWKIIGPWPEHAPFGGWNDDGLRPQGRTVDLGAGPQLSTANSDHIWDSLNYIP